MEYQFTHTMHGVMAKCSMDHEAFARWLNTEMAPEPTLLVEVFEHIGYCRTHPFYEWVLEGQEFSLYLSAEEVMVKANNIDMSFEDFDEMEEGMNFYNEESVAFCGLEDFELFLQAYQRFLKTYH